MLVVGAGLLISGHNASDKGLEWAEDPSDLSKRDAFLWSLVWVAASPALSRLKGISIYGRIR